MKRQTHNRKNLHHKIFAAFMTFAMLLIASLWVFQTVLLETFYKQIKTNTLRDTANMISSSLVKLDEIDIESLADLVTEVAMKNEISVKIIDSTSTTTGSFFSPVFSVLAEHDNILNMLRDSELYFIYEDARQNNGEMLQHYQRGAYTTFPAYEYAQESENSDDEDGAAFTPRKSYKHGAPPIFTQGITQELLYAKIITRSDGHEYFLLFDSVITPIHSTVTTLRAQLIFQSIIILIIAALAAKALAARIAKPITDITRSAKKLAAGNYEAEFSGNGYLEVSELADTLNYTAHELKESDSVKRELIANTSHDLRTPLTMIIGYAEVMRDLPGENTPENVQVIIDEATRLTTLVNDMLDLSRLQSGNAALELSEFNLTSLTERIIDRMTKMTEKDGFDFRFNFDKNIYVKADETKITQVIYNFLSNAVNYSEDSREIIINQKVTYGKVRLEFTDHGKGIPKEKLPNIWDRYYKIDNTHKRTGVGSGIGLSIVKSILELHKAKYGVISTPSVGSTFWFELDITDVIK